MGFSVEGATILCSERIIFMRRMLEEGRFLGSVFRNRALRQLSRLFFRAWTRAWGSMSIPIAEMAPRRREDRARMPLPVPMSRIEALGAYRCIICSMSEVVGWEDRQSPGRAGGEEFFDFRRESNRYGPSHRESSRRKAPTVLPNRLYLKWVHQYFLLNFNRIENRFKSNK